MEQHPVPQNVTTFQFRLIGDMTLKQFGYLAGGALLAYIFYKLPLPLFLNWPLAIIFALGGFGFAFVPIEERPMDVWVLSFFKSIYSPTQYIWSRGAVPNPQALIPPPTPAANNGLGRQMAPNSTPVPTPTMIAPAATGATATPGTRRGDILSNIFAPPQASGAASATASKSHTKSPGLLDWLFDLIMPIPHAGGQTVVPAHADVPQTAFPSTVPAKMDFSPPPTVRSRDEAIAQTAKKEAEVESKVEGLKKELASQTIAQSQMQELQQQMAKLQEERDKMEAEIARLKLQSMPPALFTPPLASSGAKPTGLPAQAGTYIATPAAKSGPSVRIITPDRAVKAGLPRLTTFANVVTGIVKDGEQNLLPGVLVTVKDKEGVPVRALKTNRLGQFAASTPLTNGTYFLEIEDPRLRYTFDRAQITLNGSIVPALEIFAKSQKEITRAKLEKELFGNNK